jgi:hypothetical protein
MAAFGQISGAAIVKEWIPTEKICLISSPYLFRIFSISHPAAITGSVRDELEEKHFKIV